MGNSELAYYYVSELSKAKRFNLQTIAINKFITNIKKDEFIKDLEKDLMEFNEIYKSFISRDIIFKNNSLVTRKTVLISPAHYFYYTKLVFDLVLHDCEEKTLNFHNGKINAFYSGVLFKDIKSINNSKQILFNNSYNEFQNKLLENERKQAIKIDLSNFFDSISIEKLKQILEKKNDGMIVGKLFNFFEHFDLKSLPQFHYSIASSILSQIYLSDFDDELNGILYSFDVNMIRFVDDMFFFTNSKVFKERDFHDFIDKINRILWKNKLVINNEKLEIYFENLFRIDFSGDVSSANENYFFKTEKKIEVKSASMVNKEFMQFILAANKLYIEKGYNVKEFSLLFEKSFNIEKDNDARKVLNNFVFSNKWQALKDEELQYIVSNFHFVFFLPDIFIILYLKIYDFLEYRNGRDDKNIRNLLNEIESRNTDSLRFLYSSIQYLIQGNFKKKIFMKRVTETNTNLGQFIKLFIEI